jgi:hypothetical protein
MSGLGGFLFMTLLMGGLFGPLLVRAIKVATPGGAVIVTSLIYFLGAAILLTREGGDAAELVFLICAAFIPVFLIGFLGAARLFGLRLEPRDPLGESFRTDPGTFRLLWGVYLLLAGFMVWVLLWSGMDQLLLALLKFAMGQDPGVSVLDLRLGFAAGDERYFAPGYVKQVRDVLLPLVALFLMFGIPRPRRRFYSVVALVLPVTSILMVSTGERGPLMLFLVGTVYSALASARRGIHSLRSVMVPIGILALLGLSGFTLLSSTFTSRGYEDSSTGVILLDRIVTRAPEENMLAARVWARRAPSPGGGWLSELSTVLPGTQTTLSNLIHEELGGGERGNSVMGMWVDVYYNFGWLMGVAVSGLMGAGLALYTHWVSRMREGGILRAICGEWLSVTMLMVLSPFGFLLYGPFVLTCVMVMLTTAPILLHRLLSGPRGRVAHA